MNFEKMISYTVFIRFYAIILMMEKIVKFVEKIRITLQNRKCKKNTGTAL